LSPTYQTWFQIANLHVWLIRARYRALPKSHANIYEQELVNHFFIDVEHRMRVALANKPPERIIKGYMNEMRDQWNGATFSYDLGLVSSDSEMSAAIWRNVFAGRGLDGKGEVVGKHGKTSMDPRPVQSTSTSSSSPSPSLTADSTQDSLSRPTTLSDTTLAELPFHLYVFTAYIRRELRRLDFISDEDVIGGRLGTFGSFESHVLAAERDFMMEQEERSLLGLDDDVPSLSGVRISASNATISTIPAAAGSKRRASASI
jgi:cytochrome b pre-mRNA-processing protein 3